MTRARTVLDASLIVRAAVGSSPEAVAALRGGTRLMAPDLVHAESANALRTYVTAGRLSARRAAIVLGEILSLRLEIRPTGVLALRALDVAVERGLSVYDSCYVVLAELEGATLVTADRRLAAAYERAELVA